MLEMEAPYGERAHPLMPNMTEVALLVKAFLQPSPDTAMFFAPFWCTHPPPPVPPILLIRVTSTNFSTRPKALVKKYNLYPSHSCEKICCFLYVQYDCHECRKGMDITKYRFELTVRLRRQTFSFGLLNFGTMILREVWGLQRKDNDASCARAHLNGTKHWNSTEQNMMV